MSTSPEDRIVNVLSRWLAGHVPNEELRGALEEAGRERLPPTQAEAVEELLGELKGVDTRPRAELEMLVRETLEALAIG
jgi:hypothetical protein